METNSYVSPKIGLKGFFNLSADYAFWHIPNKAQRASLLQDSSTVFYSTGYVALRNNS